MFELVCVCAFVCVLPQPPAGTWQTWQSILYVWSAEADGASTTVIWPGSHKAVYPELMTDRFALKPGKFKHFVMVRDQL